MIGRLCDVILKPFSVFLDIFAVESFDDTCHIDNVTQRFWFRGSYAVFEESLKVVEIGVREEIFIVCWIFEFWASIAIEKDML